MTRIRSLLPVLVLAVAFVAVAASAQSGLPEQAAAPRTLKAYTHVFVAFSVAWLLVFGYAVSVGNRFKRVEEQLTALERR